MCKWSIDKTNCWGKGWGERLMRKHPLLNISFRTLFDWCKKIKNPLAVLWNILVLLPLICQFLASIRFYHGFFTFFYPSVEQLGVLHSSFVAGTFRGSSKRNLFCFGFFFVSYFIKSIFSPPSLSTASSSSHKSPESSVCCSSSPIGVNDVL